MHNLSRIYISPKLCWPVSPLYTPKAVLGTAVAAQLTDTKYQIRIPAYMVRSP